MVDENITNFSQLQWVRALVKVRGKRHTWVITSVCGFILPFSLAMVGFVIEDFGCGSNK